MPDLQDGFLRRAAIKELQLTRICAFHFAFGFKAFGHARQNGPRRTTSGR
jgi:hypothetical protein